MSKQTTLHKPTFVTPTLRRVVGTAKRSAAAAAITIGSIQSPMSKTLADNKSEVSKPTSIATPAAETAYIIAELPLYAQGITVVNDCNSSITVNNVINHVLDKGNDLHYVLATGQRITLPFMKNTNAGVAVQAFLTGEDSTNRILQAEYNAEAQWVRWDISHVNSNPFEAVDYVAYPAGKGVEKCDKLAIVCPAGEVCHDAYQHPEDDTKSFTCPSTLDSFVLNLCAPKEIMKAANVLQKIHISKKRNALSDLLDRIIFGNNRQPHPPPHVKDKRSFIGYIFDNMNCVLAPSHCHD